MISSPLLNGIFNASIPGKPEPEAEAEAAGLTNLPQEILLHIAKQLPTVLDVFVLRQACRSLYNRLGPSSGTLYYHFLNNCNGPHRRRFSHYHQDADYFAFTKEILSGKIHGCGLCLRDARHNAVDAYRGGIFYKTLCKTCARENFKELWRLEDEYPGLKIHPNDRITWEGGHPFDDPGYNTGRWLSRSHLTACIRNIDLQALIAEQLKPPSTGSKRNLGKESWEARYDKQIRFAHKKKESADIVVRIMTEEYKNKYPQLHWLQGLDGFSEYLYNALLWNLRPWLAPHHGDKALPKFTLGDRMEELLESYSESEELVPELRLKSLQSECKEVLTKELSKIPKPGQVVGRSGRVAPLIRYWLEDWLKKRDYKGVPKDRNKDLRNTPRYCPFCPPAETPSRFNCTLALSVHVWCQHPEKMEENWQWIENV